MIAKRVLVVDDNRHAADSLAAVLGHWGYEVRIAYDGPAAVEVASAFIPDVVVLDIELPSMSGYEVARRLRETAGFGDLVLLALSGHDRRDVPRGQDIGEFDHYLHKPLHFEQLRGLLAAAGGSSGRAVGCP